MRDRFKQIIDETLAIDNGYNIENLDLVVDRIIAALPDMVQPLVWREETSGYWFADYPMGRNLDVYRAHQKVYAKKASDLTEDEREWADQCQKEHNEYMDGFHNRMAEQCQQEDTP